MQARFLSRKNRMYAVCGDMRAIRNSSAYGGLSWEICDELFEKNIKKRIFVVVPPMELMLNQ